MISRLTTFKRSEAVFLVIVATLVVTSVSVAARTAEQVKTGSAADFVAMFPMLVVGLFAGLVSLLSVLIIYILRQFCHKTDSTAQKLDQTAAETTRKIDAVVDKMESFAQNLYDRDHQQDQKIADFGERLTVVETTCAAKDKLCPLTNHSGVFCFERRHDSGGRRESDNESGPLADRER